MKVEYAFNRKNYLNNKVEYDKAYDEHLGSLLKIIEDSGTEQVRIESEKIISEYSINTYTGVDLYYLYSSFVFVIQWSENGKEHRENGPSRQEYRSTDLSKDYARYCYKGIYCPEYNDIKLATADIEIRGGIILDALNISKNMFRFNILSSKSIRDFYWWINNP